MITEDDSDFTFEFENYYAILAPFLLESEFYKNNGKKVKNGFTFNSNNNPLWHTQNSFREVLQKIGFIN